MMESRAPTRMRQRSLLRYDLVLNSLTEAIQLYYGDGVPKVIFTTNLGDVGTMLLDKGNRSGGVTSDPFEYPAGIAL